MPDVAENAGWEWWTADDVSRATGIPRPTLYSWIHRGGKGPPFYKQGTSIRYRSDEVLAWIKRGRRAGDGTVPPDRARDRGGRFLKLPA